MSDEAFDSRDGTGGYGKDYEYLMAAYYGLTFSFNNEIIDFKLSTNNDDFGDFDDVVIEAKFSNGEEHVFALQLKHVTRPVAQITLVNKNKKFSLKKYSNEFQKVKSKCVKKSYDAPFKNFHFILFTTSGLEKCEEFNEEWKKLEPIVNGEKFQTDLFIRRNEDDFQRELLNASQCEENLLFKFKSENEDLPDEEFFQQFSFYTKQKSAKEIESLIAEIILKKFKNSNRNVVLNYLNYFSYWCRRDYGAFKLTKQDVRVKLAELVLTPYIAEPNLEAMAGISEKEDLFLDLVTSCDIVLIDENSEEIITKTWNLLIHDYATRLKQWDAPISGFYIEALKANIDIPISALNENFCELSLKKLCLLLWHFANIPMVVKIDKNSTNRDDVQSAVELSEHNGERRFILIDEDSLFNFKSKPWIIFRNLSDISRRNSYVYNELIEKLLISLQGRPYILLKEFINLDGSLMNAVQTKDIVNMFYGNFLVGNDCKKEFPETYIRRLIPKILIDTEAINKLQNDLFVVSSNKIIENIFSINLINIDKYLILNEYEDNDFLNEFKTMRKAFFIFAEGGCTVKQFEEICSMNKERSCHHVRLIDEKSVEWIESRGTIKNLQNYRLDLTTLKPEDFVKEEDVHGHFRNKLNIICAEPGMGKSVLIRVLAFNCPSDHWLVNVNLGEHVNFFKEKKDFNEILDYFLKKGNQTFLEKETISILWSKQHVMFFWDGFDELPDACVDSVVAAVETLADSGYPQWLTARNSSKKFLENTFGMLSLTVTEFTPQNQYDYTYVRLLEKSQDREKANQVIDRVSDDISRSLNCGYLDYSGIPLQIHMSVEIYLRNPDNPGSNPKFITLTDMYQQFVEGKFDNLFQKANADLDNYYMQQIREQYTNAQMDLYEIAAMKASFGKLFDSLDIEIHEEVEVSEDTRTLGLIVGINDDNKLIFAHKTYEEFLAALWLSKHWHKHPELVENLFEEQYSNIRLMFDMLLARDSPVHLGVLYRNMEIIKLHQGKIASSKDKGGRTALQVACSWGHRHPVIKVMENDVEIISEKKTSKEARKTYFMYFVNLIKEKNAASLGFLKMINSSGGLKAVEENLITLYDQIDNSPSVPGTITINGENCIPVETEDADYLAMLEFFLEHTDTISEIDELFKWDAYQYADRSLSLAALNVLIKYKKMDSNCLKNYNHTPTLLNYAASFSYDHLLDIVEDTPYIEYKYQIGRVSLLQIAADMNSLSTVEKLLKHKCYKNVINAQTPFDGSLLGSASFNGNSKMVDVLLKNGANINSNKSSPLAAAVFSGSIDCCKKLLEAGAEVNATAAEDFSPILASALLNQVDIMKLLLDNGADVNFIYKNYTALHFAVGTDNSEMIDILLKHKSTNINYQSEPEGFTVLHYGIKAVDTETYKRLLEHGADATIKSNNLFTPLHVALLGRKEDKALELIKAAPSVINEYDDTGYLTPIMLAATKNFPGVIRALAKYGVDLHSEKSGTTPLHEAAFDNVDSCVVALIEAGASVNYSDKDGATPLLLSTKCLTTVKILLDNSADITAKCNYGKTVLHYAAEDGNIDVMEELIRRGAEIDAKDNQGITPLYFAIENKHLQVTTLLLDQGASLESGTQLLHLAVSKDLPECISLLSRKDVDVNAKDKFGRTPLLAACRQNNTCVQTLLENRADPNITWLLDISPLCFSLLFGNTKVMTQLIEAGADVKKVFRSLSALHLAAYIGDIFSVILLTRNGVDVNAIDDYECIPLHYACGENLDVTFLKSAFGLDEHTISNITLNCSREDCAKECLGRGAKINQKNAEGNTSLHLACSSRNSGIIKLLVEHGANVNELDNEKKTPLHKCYEAGEIEAADILLQDGADLHIMDESGRKPLDYAMARIHSQDLQQLDLNDLEKLFTLGVDINLPKDDTGLTLLHMAAKEGNANVTEYLVKKGANVESTTTEGCTPIFYACCNNHKEVASILIENNCMVNVQDNTGNTPLHVAAELSFEEIIMLIVNAGGGVNTKNNTGRTSLHLAAQAGKWNSCKVLAECSANIDQPDNLGSSPLHFAVTFGNEETVKVLIDSGANLDQKDDKGWTPLFQACTDGNLDLVKFLHDCGADLFAETYAGSSLLTVASQHTPVIKYLIENGLNVNHVGNDNVTPLHTTCLDGNYEGNLCLLKNDANINVVTEKENLTPLQYAAINGHSQIVELLLTLGADFTIKSATGCTPLINAIVRNHVEVVKIFIERATDFNSEQSGAAGNVESTTTGNCTPIFYACNNHKEVLSIPIENNCMVNVKDNNGNTPLHFAAELGYEEIIMLIVKAGGDVNTKNNTGHTPLHLAAHAGKLNSCKVLAECGANIDQPDNLETCPLHFAVTFGNEETVKVLVDSGANLDQKDDKGWTPLFHACSDGNLDMIRLLLDCGADLFAETYIGSSLLTVASQHTPVIKYLVENGLNVNHGSNDNVTPLHTTCLDGNYEGTLCLLKNDANINVATKKENLTPLQYAAMNGHSQIVELLLTLGADFTIESAIGRTPLINAVLRNRVEVVKIFIERAKDFSSEQNDFLQSEWRNSLFISVANAHLEMSKCLLERGLTTIDAKNEHNSTALHVASSFGKYDAANYLIENGADINEKNIEGLTPLYFATLEGQLDMIKLLVVDHKAEVDSLNFHGNTPLFCAASKGYLEITEFLHQHGANINVIDDDGDTPLHDAANNGHLSVVQFLISQKAIMCKNKNGKDPLDLAVEKGNKEIIEFLENKLLAEGN